MATRGKINITGGCGPTEGPHIHALPHFVDCGIISRIRQSRIAILWPGPSCQGIFIVVPFGFIRFTSAKHPAKYNWDSNNQHKDSAPNCDVIVMEKHFWPIVGRCICNRHTVTLWSWACGWDVLVYTPWTTFTACFPSLVLVGVLWTVHALVACAMMVWSSRTYFTWLFVVGWNISRCTWQK